MSLRSLAVLVLIPFSAITVAAVIYDGSNGFANAITHNLTSLQIWVDLVIAMLFWCGWVLKDAKDSGRNGWPWVIAALIVGAFSPLIYMVVHRRWPASPGPDSQPGNATTRRSVAAFGLLALGGLTCAALMADGTDIAATVTASWSNFQIWLDLVIVMVLWLGWMFVDARRSGINPWGWLVFGLVLGSFAPLLYTVMHNRWPASHPPEG